MSDPSPPGNRDAALSGGAPKDQECDTRRISEESTACNRKLIRSERSFDVYQVQDRRRRFHYEITDGSRTWTFPLLWSAYNKLDRLVAKVGGAQ